jgi:hypothetical protein
MDDHEPLAVGDTVRRRDQPWLTGTVWSIERDMTSLVERESSSSRGTIPIRTRTSTFATADSWRRLLPLAHRLRQNRHRNGR